MIYLQLFWVYFKIGLFAFGGGYAILPLIQRDVVEHYKWISQNDFTDIVAISQMTPGPIGINSATYIGYEATGSAWGAAVASFAICLPSFLLMLYLAKMLMKFRDNAYVSDFFSWIRPVAVGLIAAAGLMLMNDENFIDYKSILICVATFIAAFRFKAHPIPLILGAGLAGFLLYS